MKIRKKSTNSGQSAAREKELLSESENLLKPISHSTSKAVGYNSVRFFSPCTNQA